MDINLLIHTIASIIALISGAMIFLYPKGTPLHKKTGYTYIVSMIACLITSFFIFDLFDSFGVYHVCSVISAVTMSIGMLFPFFGRKNKRWIEQHMIWMSYSCIGLVMAGGSHLFYAVPSNWPVELKIGLFWIFPYVAGSILIFTRFRSMAKAAAKNMTHFNN